MHFMTGLEKSLTKASIYGSGKLFNFLLSLEKVTSWLHCSPKVPSVWVLHFLCFLWQFYVYHS